MLLYFMSKEQLGTQRDPYHILADLGLRLRKAMGDKEIMPYAQSFVPTYRDYAKTLDRSAWRVYRPDGQQYMVVPYSDHYDGWKATGHNRIGFMAGAISSYEYAYDMWDHRTHEFHPDLFDNATFASWLELLPQPVSVVCGKQRTAIMWSDHEPRVHRAQEMGRYTLAQDQCAVCVDEASWRLSRAEAYVCAWEKMAANEPADRYESILRAEQQSRR